MRKPWVLLLIAALAPQVAGAREIRHPAIPEPFWGTWAPADNGCKEKDAAAIVLSATAYAGPAGSCVVKYVTEIPGRGGAIYSARLECPGGAQPQAKKFADLIIRPGDGGQISLGPTFESLAAHRRCPASGPAAKQQ